MSKSQNLIHAVICALAALVCVAALATLNSCAHAAPKPTPGVPAPCLPAPYPYPDSGSYGVLCPMERITSLMERAEHCPADAGGVPEVESVDQQGGVTAANVGTVNMGTP